MAGKRHHTIPQFLLRGFASSRRGTETYVWLYRKGRGGLELNTLNVAAERYFYGKPNETDLDERITAREVAFSQLVDELRSNPAAGDVPLVGLEIPELVAHLAYRNPTDEGKCIFADGRGDEGDR